MGKATTSSFDHLLQLEIFQLQITTHFQPVEDTTISANHKFRIQVIFDQIGYLVFRIHPQMLHVAFVGALILRLNVQNTKL